MKIKICEDKQETGRSAARDGAELIRAALAVRGKINIILATGASQFEMLDELVQAPEIDWSRVTVFHLDEYEGLPQSHPASFRRYLKERFASKVPLQAFHYINAENDCAAECRRLGGIISESPIEVAFVGIGENGHLAFNDPPADFDTEEPYIIVTLDEACRRQQMGEGWFSTIDEVPRRAISMSIQQIMKSRSIVCTVPDDRKARAVKCAVTGPLTPDVPASILQRHDRATIYLDPDSASLLPQSREKRATHEWQTTP